MKLAIYRFFYRLFNWGMCHKEALGYNCKHGIHNGVRECDGKRVS